MNDLENLGKRVEYDTSGINPLVLETFGNPMAPGSTIAMQMDHAEFTSLCPVTGQPDYGKIFVSYEPDLLCVESKSYKMYLMGFRNARIFHEAVAQRICDDLVAAVRPKSMLVRFDAAPRGGIAFIPTAVYVRRD